MLAMFSSTENLGHISFPPSFPNISLLSLVVPLAFRSSALSSFSVTSNRALSWHRLFIIQQVRAGYLFLLNENEEYLFE